MLLAGGISSAGGQDEARATLESVIAAPASRRLRRGGNSDNKHKETQMFYEFRQYKMVDESKREAWVKFMEEVVIPFQVSKGMVVLGSFVDEEDKNLYYWIRRFKSEEERVRLYKAVYESDEWKNEIGPKIPDMMDRSAIVVKRIVPTDRSVIQ